MTKKNPVKIASQEKQLCGKEYLCIIVGSQGSFNPLKEILNALPVNYSLAVIVATHRTPDTSGLITELLADHCLLPVTEVEDKDKIEAGHIYIAPSNYHLLLEKNTLALSTDPPVNFARPSFDVLLQSAAMSYGYSIVCVILSGASNDGAVGASYIAESGGMVLIQEPGEAECPIMPQAVFDEVPLAKPMATQAICKSISRLDNNQNL
jgi:two-component system, chemotaxis family, protein-glutamate methylesterase/glutaminase